jgi:hypothetical protein
VNGTSPNFRNWPRDAIMIPIRTSLSEAQCPIVISGLAWQDGGARSTDVNGAYRADCLLLSS